MTTSCGRSAARRLVAHASSPRGGSRRCLRKVLSSTRADVMQMKLSDFARDTYVAPKMSELTTCGAPPLSEWQVRARGSLADFIITSMLRVSFQESDRQYLFNVVRRVEGAIEEYENARNHLLAHVAAQDPNAVSHYVLALMHFENCISQIAQANMLVARWTGNKIFEAGDGSPHHRLNFLYNRSKHIYAAINSGQLPSGGTVPLWITNDGLECDGEKVG